MRGWVGGYRYATEWVDVSAWRKSIIESLRESLNGVLHGLHREGYVHKVCFPLNSSNATPHCHCAAIT